MKRRAALLALALGTLGSASLATAVTVQKEDLRITVLAQLKPYKLPRSEPAPIAIFVGGHLESSSGKLPPQLQRMRIKVNRHGLLRSRGLPVCPTRRLAGASSEKALELCSGALIGSGRFWAHIVLPEQGAYPTRGRLLIFNGRRHGRPAVLAHIFTSNPFDSAFTISFGIRRIDEGQYGTELFASLPESLGSWGYLDRIKLNLRREYRYRGRKLSYFNAACPAPGGADRTAFSLAAATLYFRHTEISATVDKACGVKR